MKKIIPAMVVENCDGCWCCSLTYPEFHLYCAHRDMRVVGKDRIIDNKFSIHPLCPLKDAEEGDAMSIEKRTWRDVVIDGMARCECPYYATDSRTYCAATESECELGIVGPCWRSFVCSMLAKEMDE